MLEHDTGVNQLWVPGSPVRVAAEQLRADRRYHERLDDLEHRALSRKFEVEKLGLPKTGMYVYSLSGS
jgi:hypothetical protein